MSPLSLKVGLTRGSSVSQRKSPAASQKSEEISEVLHLTTLILVGARTEATNYKNPQITMGSCLSKSDVEEDGMVSSLVRPGGSFFFSIFHLCYVRDGAGKIL